MPEQRYFVTGMQRSGTSVIHHGLRGHPQISAFKQEVAFNRFFRHGASYFCWGKDLAENEKERAPSALFDALAGLGASVETRVFGMKCLMFNPSHAHDFVKALKNHFPNSLVVRIRRDDPVAQFGSLIKAQKTGVWQRRNSSTRNKIKESKSITEEKNEKKIKIDKYELLDYVISKRSIEKTLDKISKTHRVLEINYEEGVKERELRDVSSFEPFYDFLGVDSVSPRWIQTQKLSPPPEEYITNYQSLSEFAQEVRDQLVEGMSPQAVRQRYGPPVTRRIADSIRWHLSRPILTVRKVRDKCIGN